MVFLINNWMVKVFRKILKFVKCDNLLKSVRDGTEVKSVTIYNYVNNLF